MFGKTSFYCHIIFNFFGFDYGGITIENICFFVKSLQFNISMCAL